mgnify:CR=1 FL=1
MQILLTGAAGFIGSATALELAQRGNRVLAVDNFSTYYSVSLKEKRVAVLLQHPLIEFKRCDLADEQQVQDLFINNSITSVVHLAAQAGVRVPITAWDNYTKDNLQAFSNLLVNSARNRLSDFLYASSSSVYGNTQDLKFVERETKTSPVSFYGATKLSNEIIAETFSKATGIKTRGLRFFTVYGPWGRPDMVYFRMIVSALHQTPFDFYGDGSIERDFTYITDVVEINCKLLEELREREDGFSDEIGRAHV